jgi:hypothetical protein
MNDPSVIIAAVSAALQAVQTWIKFRDSHRASRTAERAFKRTADAKLAVTQAGRLRRVVPDDVLETIEQRVETCWDRYRHIIDPETGSTPSEIDKATQVLKRCICQELHRIQELNGSIPAGKLRQWWDTYCRAEAGSGERSD